MIEETIFRVFEPFVHETVLEMEGRVPGFEDQGPIEDKFISEQGGILDSEQKLDARFRFFFRKDFGGGVVDVPVKVMARDASNGIKTAGINHSGGEALEEIRMFPDEPVLRKEGDVVSFVP